MKKALFCLPLLLFLVAIAGCSTPPVEDMTIEMYGYDGDGKMMTAENEFLTMELNPFDTSFTLKNKNTGEEWASNPADGANDAQASADSNMKSLLQSQFALTYANVNGVETTFSNFKYSVEKGLFQIEQTANGFDIHYTVGDIDRIYFIPTAVPESRMMEYYEQFSKKEKRQIDEYYRKYDINKLRTDDNKDELLANYPDLANEPIYTLRDNSPKHIKVAMENLFAEYGYTEEDYITDRDRYNVTATSKKPTFNVTVRYELDGADFKVSIPFEGLRYKSDNVPTKIQVLPFFGCGGLEDEGYLFVPDGSGAIINFNNGKQNMDSFVTNMYGWDTGMLREMLVIDNRAQMPVFGIKRNGNAVLCIIEEGASYGVIDAGVSQKRSSYNNVSASYNLVRGEKMDISAKSDKTIMMYQVALPKENIVQRYRFCDREDYVGMAETYRQYLIDKYHLEKMTESGVPVAVEITGAVNKVKFIMGLPFDMPLKLTSFNEAQEIVENLNSRGWSDVSYKMNGWFNDSLLHSVPTDIKLIGELGSKKDLQNLTSAIAGYGNDLYYEADFMMMKDNNLTDGFSTYGDAARYLNRERVVLYPFAITSYIPADWMKMSYLATPEYTMKLIDGFMPKMEKYGTRNIAFRNLGQTLAANYNEKEQISREAVARLQEEKFRELQKNGSQIMVKAGNAYSIPYADFITDAALPDKALTITDHSIPFYEIVLHALVPFSGGAINLASDYSGNLLRSVEAGAGLYFSFIEEDAILLQDSLFYEYYANQFSLWVDEADRVYQRIGADFDDCANQYIVDHQIITPTVTKTVYENGTAVIVNHGVAPYDYEGTVIQERSYLVLEGGGIW